MFIEGVPSTALWDLCCEAIKKEEELGIPASKIEVYSQEANPLVLPSCCKSGWNLPLKLYCVFLALCVVRSLGFAGWEMEEREQDERHSSRQ